MDRKTQQTASKCLLGLASVGALRAAAPAFVQVGASTPARTQSAVGFRVASGPAPSSAPQSRASVTNAAAMALTLAGTAAVVGGRRPQKQQRKSVVAVRAASTTLDTSGPLPFVKLQRGDDEATVYLFGACVASYKTKGTEWLAVRPDAKFDKTKAISGGLPICFPRFGNGHGFARDSDFTLVEEASKDGVAVLELKDSPESLEKWPHNFTCTLKVELLEDQLATTLTVENTSDGDFDFTTALHSYYDVSDIDECKVTGGFEGKMVLDKTKDPETLTECKSGERTISGFTEEIYKEVLPGSVTLSDGKGDLEVVSGGGWKDVVVWSPYGEEAMGYKKFICVESVAFDEVKLAKGEVWEGTMNLVPKAK